MRNRNFTAHLRTRRPSIHLDASQNRLGVKIHDRKKEKGNRRTWPTAYSPNAEKMGERPGHGTGLVPPKRRRKEQYKLYKINIKEVLIWH